MNTTPSSERFHIVLAGTCNSGKSSLLNALCSQKVSVVSSRPGTTTDPVKKAVELPGLGACVIVDTPGIDDNDELGALRMERSREEFAKADIIIAVIDAEKEAKARNLLESLRKYGVPVIKVVGKSDLAVPDADNALKYGEDAITVSAVTGEGLDILLKRLASEMSDSDITVTGNLVRSGDIVVLVMPQDKQAPKGRLILPQVQTLRELLDKGCITICCTPHNLADTLSHLDRNPDLIITDSQVFPQVSAIIPEQCRLTSFSVLMAAYKGDAELFLEGIKALDAFTSRSRVLIAEACSHVPQTEDIGRVKIPRLLRSRFGSELQIDFCNGADFPEDLSAYDLIIHCGGCMFTRRHVLSRVRKASVSGVPITNYGMLLAHFAGILPRVVLP